MRPSCRPKFGKIECLAEMYRIVTLIVMLDEIIAVDFRYIESYGMFGMIIERADRWRPCGRFFSGRCVALFKGTI